MPGGDYPVQFSVEYPDRSLNRLTTFSTSLRELYDAAAAAQPFSLVIGCTFDPKTLTIRTAEALTPPRLHTESS